MCPMYLGVKAILTKSFARIHHDNLVNFGVVPLTFAEEADYDAIEPGDMLEMRDMRPTCARGGQHAGSCSISPKAPSSSPL